MPNVKQRLGIGTPLGEASPAEIVNLLAGGAVIELDNGWQLTTARIAGDEVVEVVLNGVPANRAELERYGLSEEIINYKRRWFVVLDKAHAVLPLLLAQRRAVRDASSPVVTVFPAPLRLVPLRRVGAVSCGYVRAVESAAGAEAGKRGRLFCSVGVDNHRHRYVGFGPDYRPVLGGTCPATCAYGPRR